MVELRTANASGNTTPSRSDANRRGLGTMVNRRRALALIGGSLAGTALVSACSSTAPAAASAPTADLYLTVVTGGMLQHKGWPAFIPTDVSVPANSVVNVRIANFDDGTAALPATSSYGKVTGTIGNNATSAALSGAKPNAPAAIKTYSELPLKDVSHTFTVTGLGLNVPFLINSVASFSFKTGKPGTYTWQCMAPCGSGSDGMGGAMTEKGYMVGTLRVT